MGCDHIYDLEGEAAVCFECGRPRNAIERAQRWINAYDAFDCGLEMTDLEKHARDIIEWLLEDLEHKRGSS